MRIDSRLEKVLHIAFILLVILFFGFYIRDIDFNALATVTVSWGALMAASAVALAFRYWGVLVWKMILIDLGASNLPGFAVLSNIYSKAWLARYIPGTVAWIASKVYMASKYGISKSRLAVSSILEGGMQVVAISTISIFMLVFDSRLNVIPPPVKSTLFIVGLSLLVLLLPPVFNRLIKKAYRLIKRTDAGAELQINRQAVGRSFLLYTIGAFITGTSYFLLTVAVNSEISGQHYIFVVGAFNLAGAIGMATPFVPSGLGIRDGIQLILLSIIMPKEIAFLITVLSRLWSAAIDIFFYLITRIITLQINYRKT